MFIDGLLYELKKCKCQVLTGSFIDFIEFNNNFGRNLNLKFCLFESLDVFLLFVNISFLSTKKKLPKGWTHWVKAQYFGSPKSIVIRVPSYQGLIYELISAQLYCCSTANQPAIGPNSKYILYALVVNGTLFYKSGLNQIHALKTSAVAKKGGFFLG